MPNSTHTIGTNNRECTPRDKKCALVIVLTIIIGWASIICAIIFIPPNNTESPIPYGVRMLQGNNPSVATATTQAPTRKPTPAPTPICAIHLPNNFTALTVVNLQFQDGASVNANTTFMIEQLTELFQSTYNKINNVKYTPCNDAYRKVQKVTHIDILEDGDGTDGDSDSDGAYIPTSFVFRRQLSKGEPIDQNTRVANATTTTTTIEGQSSLSQKTIPTHYVRIGRRSSDDEGSAAPLQGSGRRRILQEDEHETESSDDDDDSWIHVSLLFEATVACRGIFCIGDNAELFGPVVINKNGFSRAYAQNVARSLRWSDMDANSGGTSSSSGSNDASSSSSSTTTTTNSSPTGVIVDTVREIEEQSCPSGDQEVEFTKTVIVELVLPPSNDKEPFTDPDDPRFGAIEEAYVTTYNRLIRNEFCDPFFRRLVYAEVVAIGRTNTNTNANTNANTNTTKNKTVLPLEMRITGNCKGCDPNAIDIYAAPSVLVGPTTSSTNARSLVASNIGIGSSNADDKWLLPSTTTAITTIESQGRSLQDEIDTNGKCYCDAQPFGKRPPFESEFVARFQRSVEALRLKDFSTANSCQFGTTFSTGLVMTFSKSEFQSLQDPNDNGTTKSILESSLKKTLNELLGVTTDSCNKDFRVIENVTLVLGTNITRTSYPTLPQFSSSPITKSSTDSNSNSAIPEPTTRNSGNNVDDTISLLGGDDRRSLRSRSGLFSTTGWTGWKRPIVRFEKINYASFSNLKASDTGLKPVTVTVKSNSTTANCVASNALEIVECCEFEQQYTITVVNPSTNEKSTIRCNDEKSSVSPTHSPFDATAAIELVGSGVPVLFFVSGVCSGCDDTLLTGLSNDVVRKLSTTSSSGSSPLSAPNFSRGLLEEEERAKSDCFCPINATQTSGELEASVLSETYKENLERENVGSEIEIIDEIDVVECDDVIQEFTTTAILTLTVGNLVDADVEMLEESFKDVYNYLSALYCDPYFREITDIEDYEVLGRTRKRNRKSRRLDEEDCADEIDIELYVRGTCLSCEDGQPLFDAGSHDYDRRRNLRSLFDSYKLSTFHNDGIRRNTRRRLEASDVCFCEGETFADRAPSFDEFFAIYEDEALSVPDVCEVINIDAEEEKEYDDDGIFDDYYEELFIDWSQETSTIDPDYFIDTELPTDFPTEPEEDIDEQDIDEEDIDEEDFIDLDEEEEETEESTSQPEEDIDEEDIEFTLEPTEETEESTSQPEEDSDDNDTEESTLQPEEDIDEEDIEFTLEPTEETEESTSQPEEDSEALDEIEEDTEESTLQPTEEDTLEEE